MGESPLIDLLAKVGEARDRLAQSLGPEPIDGAKEEADRKAAKDVIRAFDAYVASITTDAEGAGGAPLIEAALAEMATGEAQPADALLFLDIASQAADAVTAFSVLKGSRAAFLGYVQAYFVLTRPNGRVLGAEALSEHVSAEVDLDSAAFSVEA